MQINAPVAVKRKRFSKLYLILMGCLLFICCGSAIKSNASIVNAGDGKAVIMSNGYKFLAAWPNNQWLFNIADIAADGKGNFYIADKASNEIKIYDKSGKLIAQWPTGYTGPYTSPAGYHIAVDKDGFIYVAESIDNCIKKFNSQGKLRAKWGSKGEGDGQFTFMGAITVDDNGYMYVIDGSRVQKLDYRGRFVAAWGKNYEGYAGSKAPGEFDLPRDIVAGKDGNIYVSDPFNERIQKLTADGKFLMQFGNFKSSNDFGDAAQSITVDKDGNIYVVDVTNSAYTSGVFGCYIQKYDSNGKFLFQFGDYKSEINDPAPNNPGLNGIAVDGLGNIYTANSAAGFECVEKYSATGKKLVRWKNEFNGNGKFNQPTDVALDTKGNVYVADRINRRVQKFSSSGKYLTQWGNSVKAGKGRLWEPISIATDKNCNVYVTDSVWIKKYSSTGKFLMQWGGGGSGKGKFGVSLLTLAIGNDSVYVADETNHLIQVFTLKGKFVRQWGGKGTGAGKFGDYCLDVAADNKGNVYVVDGSNNLIQKFSSNGKFLKQWQGFGTKTAGTSLPYMIGIGIDSSGNVYALDEDPNCPSGHIQKYDSNGKYLLQVASSGTDNGQFDFNYRGGLVADTKGRLYITDTHSNRIQVLAPVAAK